MQLAGWLAGPPPSLRASAPLRENPLRTPSEIEELRDKLARAIEIAEDSTDSLMDWDEKSRSETQRKNYAELSELKSSLSSL